MTTRAVEVRQATVADLDLLVPLFDAYRQFYRQPSEPERIGNFSIVRGRRCHGVHPTLSELLVWGAGIFILNDLFVAPAARGRGAGSALLKG